jgi:hypothetical protein
LKKFIIIKRPLADDDCGQLISYGISYYDGRKNVEIHDITSDKKQINFIAKLFNKEQPEPIHIMEILENYLIDFTDF